MPKLAHLYLYVFSLISISGLWAGFARMPGVFTIGFCLALWLIHRSYLVGSVGFEASTADRPMTVPSGLATNWVSILWVAGPAAYFLGSTWSQEFPFLGDQDFHLTQAELSIRFWRPVYGIFLLGLGLTWRFSRSIFTTRNAVLIGLAFYGLGRLNHDDLNFATRYPGGFHFLLFPFFEAARFLEWDSPLNAMRLVNFLSIFGWLGVLRPWILKRWPSPEILPFALYVFWQKDIVYFLNSAYLESWALVLILVAVECILLGPAQSAWKSLLCLGAASMFKEQSILLLPFFGAAIWFHPRRSMNLNALTTFLMTAVLPFAVYFALRRVSGIWRTVEWVPIREAFSSERVFLFLHRSWIQFGPSVALVLGGAALVWWFAWKDRERTSVWIGFGLAAIGQVLFFFMDRVSLPFAGYPRFQFIPMILLGSGLLAAGRRAVGFSLGIVFIHLITLVPFLREGSQSDPIRNFTEHTDAPVFLPIQELVSLAHQKALLQPGGKLRIQDPLAQIANTSSMGIFPMAYPAISRRYEVTLSPFASDSGSCRCQRDQEAVIWPVIHFAHLGIGHPQQAVIEERARLCEIQIRASCKSVLEAQAGGRITGFFGVGIRQN